ncbi:MAG: hypothetical protein QXU46_07085, partial [Candidatus Bathyarchaeia archaeon]
HGKMFFAASGPHALESSDAAEASVRYTSYHRVDYARCSNGEVAVEGIEDCGRRRSRKRSKREQHRQTSPFPGVRESYDSGRDDKASHQRRNVREKMVR